MPASPRQRIAGLFAVGALLLIASSADAQVGRAYCNVTNVDAIQLSNAVRVNIQCDGQIQGGMELGEYLAFDPLDDSFTAVHPVRRVSFYLVNVKSKIGTFIEIGRYPVSHLELTPFPDSPDGVGVVVTLALYVEGAMRSVDLPFEQIREEWLAGSGFGPKPGEIRWAVQEADDHRGVEIIVTTDRFPVTEEADGADATNPQLLVTSENGRIDVRAVHAPVTAVLDAIGREGGLAIEAPEVTQTISMYLADADPASAVKAIAALQGMDVTTTAGGLRLSGLTASGWGSYPEAEVRTIPLRYIKPAEALRLLPVFLLRYVAEEDLSNSLVASGPRALLAKIAQDVAEVDLPAKQIEVVIQALTYFGDRGLSQELGLETRFHGVLSDIDTAGTFDVLMPLAGGLADDVEARLTALRRRGDLKTRVRKRIRVVNGEKAELFVGQQPTIVTTYWDYMVNAPSPQLETIDVGAGLEVEPWTGSGEYITIHLEPTVTSIRDVDANTNLPTLSVRRSESTIRVRNGESVYVGGMTLSQTGATERGNSVFDGWPLLDDIFTGRFKFRRSAEIAFIVTPRVVQ